MILKLPLLPLKEFYGKYVFLAFSIIVVVNISCIQSRQPRKIYCITGKCVTVWKTASDSCYIIPGRYDSINKPNGNFILMENDVGLTIFFSNELPNALIYLSDDSVKIHSVDNFAFYDYHSNTQKFESILYPPNSKVSSELKKDAVLMHIFIEEDYALDKNGKPLSE